MQTQEPTETAKPKPSETPPAKEQDTKETTESTDKSDSTDDPPLQSESSEEKPGEKR